MDNIIAELIFLFQKLPGIGEKSAERIVFYLLEHMEKNLDEFLSGLKTAREKIKRCGICNVLSSSDPCKICSDKRREEDVIMIVESSKEVYFFEKLGEYKGKYYVIDGLISPFENRYPEDLKLKGLIKRIGGIKEVIFAFPPIPEGEVTIMYLKDKLGKFGLKMTRFRYGLPYGSSFDFVDSFTLREILKNREEIK